MKTHAIIPIFIPHLGCPNDCVFCNQRKITARTQPVDQETVTLLIDQHLRTLQGRDIETIEVAFYGGSFTGLPLPLQQQYLSIAKRYKDQGLIQQIHLSTRPDYIDEAILDQLKRYGTDVIELGVQSFDETVLALSNRGHGKETIYRSSQLIKSYGFQLGHQLMVGLPGDTEEKSVASAHASVSLKPNLARLYPTLVIADTELHRMYERGQYRPLSLTEAVKRTKLMYQILKAASIRIIRVGLKSSDHISEGGDIVSGTFHPAFRQLVEGEIAKEQMESGLKKYLSVHPERITFYSKGTSFSNMIGNKKVNKDYFIRKYPQIRFSFRVKESLPEDIYLTEITSVYPSH